MRKGLFITLVAGLSCEARVTFALVRSSTLTMFAAMLAHSCGDPKRPEMIIIIISVIIINIITIISIIIVHFTIQAYLMSTVKNISICACTRVERDEKKKSIRT